MNWTDCEQLFIAIRLENWHKPWTWQYSDAYEEAVEGIVHEHEIMHLTVDESVARFVGLNHYIEGLSHDAA